MIQTQPLVHYLCLQATQNGQASYSHVHEIILGLKRRGVVVQLFEPHYFASKDRPRIFFRVLAFIGAQCRLILSRKPHAVYIRWHFFTIIVSLWAKIRGVPVIQEVNGPYEDLFLSYPWTRRFSLFFAFLMRFQLKIADAVITVTPNLVEWSRRESCHGRVYLVSNGANTDIFKPDICSSNLFLLSKNYVIFFGALSSWQGVDVMLDAINSPEWPEGVDLLIVGEGDGKSKVLEAANFSRGLFYLPAMGQHDLAELIVFSLGSLIPKSGEWSKTGLFPLKLFESLACGVPVVVSDWPGMADFVREHQCGIVVAPNDPDQLACGVAKLAADPASAKLMGSRGAEVVKTKHSWDAKAEETLCVITDVISDKLTPLALLNK